MQLTRIEKANEIARVVLKLYPRSPKMDFLKTSYVKAKKKKSFQKAVD